MLTEDLNYELPPQLIAQSPTKKRGQSRLFVYNRSNGEISHNSFQDLPELLPQKLSIFRNDVSVLKARLVGKRPNGGSVECLLLQPTKNSKTTWRCLLKPGGKIAKTRFFGLPNEYSAEVISPLEGGEYLIHFKLLRDCTLTELAQRIGQIPLPPYIKRPTNKADEKQYQTIYANEKNRTAVAAPTAGLHFSPEIIKKLELNGHSIHNLTLSIGLGTFRAIESEKIEDHSIHSEEYYISSETRDALCKGNGKRLAIGTTSVRAIEHFFSNLDDWNKQNIPTETNLFIVPPYKFRGVDYLLTNFHLPKSTLLCLVAAFLTPKETTGLALLKELYAEAVRKEYRFFSYGDAMLIL
jgi:S-adenosylmethionine:tRNA ribosyltransferase-isomerase